MDSSELVGRFELGRWPNFPIACTRTNADEDNSWGSILCISGPQHTQKKIKILRYDIENTNPITLDSETLEDV
ncbi:unnamed protein product [Schistosoma mattheei]|uniref:Uncharacterized protein n=1 Tax=Schistosoma mattheei TaxID=31246 RepID=A0A183Q6K1_9TREM|nr:unnamed protein product [Schistosoma mattheei]